MNIGERGNEKNSPPNKQFKMAKGIGAAKADEILNKLTALEIKFEAIEKEVLDIKKFMNEFGAVKQEVEMMRTTCEGFQRLEIESKKRSVLIRGLALNTRQKYETRGETKAALAALFAKLEIKPYLVDYHRLGSRRGDEDGSGIAIRVQFMDLDQKLQLFDVLKTKGKDVKEISILTDYPSFQIEEFKKLSGLGYKIRTEKPGTRTRVVPKGLGLLLQQRANATDRWTVVSI